MANFKSMHPLRFLFLSIGVTATIFLVLGLIKPWIMLWWEHKQNRKLVIIIYGTIALIGYAVFVLLFFFERK